nr:SIS domain-containing protein [uncultured Acetatifactor sp.]
MNYIIVQAGGKGSRMQILTRNKPKALVPVNNLPMIFHLFRKYPEKKFIVIGDYKYDVLEYYLREFADVDYKLVCGSGHQGTCAGLKEALAYIPDNERFMLIWCDLVLPDEYEIPESANNIIGISKDFYCRWKYENGKFMEERCNQHGVAGHFIFTDKMVLDAVPEDGEFVRWLRDRGLTFEEQPLHKTKEYGLYSEWDNLPKMSCRPFNKIIIKGDKVIKEGIDNQGRKLAVTEVAWYKKLQGLSFDAIPTIYSYEPISMELIDGKNIYEYTYFSEEQKKYALEKIITCLKDVHSLESAPYDEVSYRDAYLDKTYDRLKKVRNLVPFANDSAVMVNGKVCRNIFYHQEEVERLVMQYAPQTFVLLHGDCTFSNIMLRHDRIPVLIDPRGYFGKTEFYGDVAYDWVKLYYSLFSNYDQFNLKRFSLDIGEKDVKLEISSNGWESLEDYFFELLDGDVTRLQMKILLAIIWFSLTTYAWEDYDSICGAFYNGLYYLEEALEMESAYSYFDKTMMQLEDALKGVSMADMDRLITECEATLKSGHKIIASGLGKNVPICEKFEGTMLSAGMDAQFLHTNSAVHGDMGMVKPGDLVIMLTKSGSTAESVYLFNLLKKREGVNLWLLSCNEHGTLAQTMEKKLIVPLEHEGDPWNIMPNNSTTLYLIILQQIAMQLIKRMDITLEMFKPNHPGGAIGAKLVNS